MHLHKLLLLPILTISGIMAAPVPNSGTNIPTVYPPTFAAANTDNSDAMSSSTTIAKRGVPDADIAYRFTGFDPNCPGGTGCP